MWIFKIVCTAGFFACFGEFDQTNRFYIDDTIEECYRHAEHIARLRRLTADKWKIKCFEMAETAKRPQ